MYTQYSNLCNHVTHILVRPCLCHHKCYSNTAKQFNEKNNEESGNIEEKIEKNENIKEKIY
jgi:predicted amidophosphoribosyltransferase